MKMPPAVSKRYRNMRLEGRGAEPGMLGNPNFRNAYMATMRIIGFPNAPITILPP